MPIISKKFHICNCHTTDYLSISYLLHKSFMHLGKLGMMRIVTRLYSSFIVDRMAFL